jgi:hypothetical protein
MFGVPTAHPLTDTVLLIVLLCGAVLLAGAVMGPRWSGRGAVWARGVVALLALGAAVSFEIFAPAGGLEGAGRLLTLWPLVVLDAVFFAIWVWRGRKPRSE